MSGKVVRKETLGAVLAHPQIMRRRAETQTRRRILAELATAVFGQEQEPRMWPIRSRLVSR